MKLTIDRDALIDTLDIGAAATKSRGVPILSGVRIDTTGDTAIEVATTDLDLTITTTAIARVDDSGAMVLPFAPLQRIAKSLAPGAVTIGHVDSDPALALIDATGANAHLSLFPVEEWPHHEAHAETEPVRLGAEAVAGLTRIVHAASHDQSRPILCGVRLDGDMAVATDSYRAAVWMSPEPLPTGTVPATALAAVLATEPTELEVRSDGESRMWVTSRETTWAMSLITGAYPDVSKFRRDSHEQTLSTDRAEFEQALVAMGALADDSAAGTATLIEASDGVLTMSKTHKDTGDITRTLDCDSNGDVQRIGVRAQFMRDIVRHVVGDRISLGMAGPTKPVQVDCDTCWFILMPVRV